MKSSISHPRFGTLLVNPHVEKLVLRGDDRLLIYFPVRGKGLLRLRKHSKSVALLRQMLPVINGEVGLELVTLDDRTLEWLVNHGILVTKDSISRRIFYDCDLNRYLVYHSGRTHQRHDIHKQHLPIVNPTIAYSQDGQIPLIYRSKMPVSAPLLRVPTVWVEEPRTRLVSPYTIRGKLLRAFEALYLSSKPLSYLEDSILRLFRDIGILIDPESAYEGAKHGLRNVDFAKTVLEQGYGIVSNVFRTPQINSMQAYYKALAREGWMEPNDDQVNDRYVRYCDPLATFWHRQMGDFISDLMQSPWQPSYTYVVSYRPGAVLKRHLDRDQSELSLTVPIDCYQKVAREHMWPLYLDVKGLNRTGVKTATITCGIGDGVVYHNTKTFHYRPELPKGHSYTAIIFFFVPEHFKGSLD